MSNDPTKGREERRAKARQAALAMNPERQRELADDDRRAVRLRGGFDAVSVPIEADPGPAPFIESPRNDWLLPVGSGKTVSEGALPQRLNAGGWVYLRFDQRLAARVQFLGGAWMGHRFEHIPTGDHYEDRGPGFVLQVDPNTWEYVDHLVTDREMGNGYRYYNVSEDGSVQFQTVT